MKRYEKIENARNIQKHPETIKYIQIPSETLLQHNVSECLRTLSEVCGIGSEAYALSTS